MSHEVDCYKQELRQLKFDFDNVVRELMDIRAKHTDLREQQEKESSTFTQIIQEILTSMKVTEMPEPDQAIELIRAQLGY